jgi:hypothetical protein
MRIDDIINSIPEHHCAWIGNPSTSEELELCNKHLTEKELPIIPQDYAAFLKKYNGFSYGDETFYGTNQVSSPKSNDVIEDIISANEYFAKYHESLQHCLLIGIGINHDYLFVYNPVNSLFEVYEKDTHCFEKDFNTFDEMFSEIISYGYAAIK